MRKQQGLSGGHGVAVDDGEWDRWVDDSSVDHRGRPPLRAATGSWRAAMFIILIEFSERLSYFGIATSLMIYLTKVLHQDMKVAAENSQYWMSVTTLMPLLGGFLADAYLGRFRTVLLSTAVYLLGLLHWRALCHVSLRFGLLIKLVLILPVLKANIERVFSATSLVKNRLRNSMGDELSNHFLAKFIEWDMFV
ncbi:unnamed protein product [Triticum turgidum subsp. durum]|uniref:Uncharacterized protein n=1 Tax=Triticum turgidum subsp. durum TaxID=4567 RepID=A0A9R0U1X7_TRITD|nr:unnamed protein product [Triticum turgidum subsp. durum]